MTSSARPRRPLVKPSKAIKAEATRRDLIGSARALFGAQGYAATSVEEIARYAGVTKGAVYHHFRDKDDLFRAVVEDVKRQVTDVVGAAFLSARAESETFESLVLGCRAFVEAHLDPAVQRISILDARSVLDAPTRRSLDAHYEVAVVRGAFRRAMRLGAIKPQPLVPLAHIVAGALAEACAVIAEADEPDRARAEANGVIASLLHGLRPDPPA